MDRDKKIQFLKDAMQGRVNASDFLPILGMIIVDENFSLYRGNEQLPTEMINEVLKPYDQTNIVKGMLIK